LTLPADILQFIAEYLDSIGTLEVLLLLHSDPARRWTAGELSRELRSSLLSVESSLAILLGRRLAVEEAGGAYRFHAGTRALDEKTSRLAECYRERRTAVITAIFSRPTDAVRSFADAFRFKKDKSNG